jgi:hypothetical protein
MLILKADNYYHQVENPWCVTFETTVHVTSLSGKTTYKHAWQFPGGNSQPNISTYKHAWQFPGGNSQPNISV